MRVLAIDTALVACAAAVFETDGARMLARASLAMARGHAEALMPLIARVMDEAGVEFRELDRVVVTVGPGSFTGLRVGIAAARGIALTAGKPAVGISTLSAFAAPHIANEEGAAIAAAVDARHGSVYLQVFASSGRTLVAPCVATVPDALRAAMAGPVRLVGSGAAVLSAAWPSEQERPLKVDVQDAPSIEWVARLGAAAPKTDVPPTPLYLRPPDARPQDGARLPRQ
jgi:tRNA threonylcarbamoyladenosine biosynthesis protein TsaB